MLATDVVEILGGQRTLRTTIANPMDLHDRTRGGFPYAVFDAVRAALHLSREQTAEAIGIPQRTLARRRKERRFNPVESDRLLRLARVGTVALEVIGSEDLASTWLKKANYALGSRVPLDLLDTDAGARSVEDVLWQIAYGMIS